jgi:hypothetical protein
MIELHIIHTAKPAGRSSAGEGYYGTGETQERFTSLQDAKAWCKAHLGTKHAPTYCDRKDGSTAQVGRIYSGKEQEDGKTYYKQYWVSAYEVTPVSMA